MALSNTKGFLPVITATAANLFITIIKFIGALLSNSSALFSEAIHSLADTINQILLLVGLHRSNRQADAAFEYGYGNERFFWALISACGVLFVGAGVTAFTGVESLLFPHKVEFTPIIFVILAVSFVMEFYSFLVAAGELKRDQPHLSWFRRFRLADPTTLAVFLEDAVAVLGIFVAAVSIQLSYLTGSTRWDAVGSVIIALLLGTSAVTLIIKNRTYLLGAAIAEGVEKKVIEFLEAEPVIEKVMDFTSVAVGFGLYRIKCEIEFNGSALLGEDHHEETLEDEFGEARQDLESFKRFSSEYADRIPRLMGRKIDDIEERLKKQFPSIRHIDIEIN
jgi:zinc transporter 9